MVTVLLWVQFSTDADTVDALAFIANSRRTPNIRSVTIDTPPQLDERNSLLYQSTIEMKYRDLWSPQGSNDRLKNICSSSHIMNSRSISTTLTRWISLACRMHIPHIHWLSFIIRTTNCTFIRFQSIQFRWNHQTKHYAFAVGHTCIGSANDDTWLWTLHPNEKIWPCHLYIIIYIS